jgi:diguanylate cyclase (GGDEF)-like protein
MEPSWSLHLLSEILSAFSTDDPENLRTVVSQVAEAVEAEVTAILSETEITCSVGIGEQERELLREQLAARPGQLSLQAGSLHMNWAPLGDRGMLVVGRLGDPFDLEERSLLRAMARSIELSLRLLAAISAERQAKLEAAHDATHDPLTGLPNRVLVLERLGSLIHSPPDRSHCTAVLFIDIDRFKWVNDAHGHAAGDELLVHISRILQRSMRQDDLVGRLSGDEFIVITRLADTQAAMELAQRIIGTLRQPVRVAGIELSHSASVGVCLVEPGDRPSEVIENADMAMYHAKGRGRGRCALFEPTMRDEARERLALEEDLRVAVSEGQFVCYLQPIMALEAGSLIGFEALVRWQHPRKGLIQPQAFVSAAEECGLIGEIDLSVMAQACEALGRWQQRPGREALRLSVNVSARTLGAADLVDRIEPILTASGIDPARLYLEITETSLVEDIQSTSCTIAGLQRLNLQLAIDDFGTGYSSLLYLKRFPVGLLKIDRSFVNDLGKLPRNKDDEAIARAIISLASGLGVKVVAEGVETAAQERRLMEFGCDFGQGFLYSPALPMAEVERQWLR